MIRRILIAVVLVAGVAAAEAQPLPPGKWWQRPELVRELELTAEQQQRLDEVFRSAAIDLIDAKAAVEKLQIALRGEIDRPQLRADELRRIAGRLSAARGALFERELMMLVEMRGVLTEAQWNKLRTRLDRLQERHGGPRPPAQRDRQKRRRP